MAAASFYTHVADVPLFACKLVHKAYASGSRVLVWLADEDAMARFDALLWSFEATAFVPHHIWRDGRQPAAEQGVLLACGRQLPAVTADTVVLNLSDAHWCALQPPPQRVLEIVADDVEQLAAARQRFAAYRSAGFDIQHHSRAGKN